MGKNGLQLLMILNNDNSVLKTNLCKAEKI